MKTSIDDLKLFLRIVEAGSLRQVAIETMSEPSTISRRLHALETHLNTKLIERSKVQSFPTETGKLYYTRLKGLVEQLELLDEEISGHTTSPSGLLRVTSPVDFGAMYIGPWLLELQNAHEDLRTELLLSDQFINLVEEGIDVAIRIGKLEDSSMRAKYLGDMQMTIVGSQSYFEQHPMPETPEDLQQHQFVLYNWLKTPTHIVLTKNGQVEKVKMQSRFAVNNVGAIINLVNKGAGLHYAPRWIVDAKRASHELVEILPDWDKGIYPVNALYKTTEIGFLPAKTRACVDYLGEQIEQIKL